MRGMEKEIAEENEREPPLPSPPQFLWHDQLMEESETQTSPSPKRLRKGNFVTQWIFFVAQCPKLNPFFDRFQKFFEHLFYYR